MTVKLTRKQKIKLSTSADVYNIMREVLVHERNVDRSKEHFWIACLANNHKLLLIELISFGSKRATVVEPTEVFSFALQKDASKLIMIHNHPSGELTPSFSDKALTEKMAAIGKFVNVPVLDHLIITEKSYFSFSDSGLLDKIMAESHYDLTFSQIDRLKEQMRANEKKADRRELMLKKEVESGRKEIERLKKMLALKKAK